MDSTPFRIFEVIMLICFGSSWPFAVVKTLRTKIVAGKSPVFLVLVLIGYIAGILNKFATNLDLVIWLYCLNGSMVLTEIILYLKYQNPGILPQCLKSLRGGIQFILLELEQAPKRVSTFFW